MNTNNRVPPPPRRCCTKAAGQRRHRLCPGAAVGARRAVPRAGEREPPGRGISHHSCRQHLPREPLRNFTGQKHPAKGVFPLAPGRAPAGFPAGRGGERARGTLWGGGNTERAGRRDPALLPARRPGGCAGMHPSGVLGRSQLCFLFIIQHIKGHHPGPVSARPGLQFSAQ